MTDCDTFLAEVCCSVAHLVGEGVLLHAVLDIPVSL